MKDSERQILGHVAILGAKLCHFFCVCCRPILEAVKNSYGHVAGPQAMKGEIDLEMMSLN